MSIAFGWVSLSGQPADRSIGERMGSTLAFDVETMGFLVENCLMFGHYPWYITRDDAFDRQPIDSRSGRYLLTADARIYNRVELIGELDLTGRPTERIGDGALLLAAWERWQAQALTHVEGDYAFALWDRETRTLHLARDPFGHRPLFWHQGKDFFVFASLPKVLFSLPEVPRELNKARVADHLIHLPWMGEETLLQGIQRVLPGHRLEHSERGTNQMPCRRLDPDRRIILKSDTEYLEAFGGHLERAVRERLRTARSVASHLSSGYDSSTVTAIAARLLARDGRRLSAFTAVPRDGFDGPVPGMRRGNEGPAAKALVGRFPNIDHRLVSVGPQSPLEGLHEANVAMDWPFLLPSNRLWLHRIDAEAERCGANVMLVGTKGNFTISYEGMGLLPEAVGSRRLLHWWREARALHRAGKRWRGLLFSSFGPYIPFWIEQWITRHAGKRKVDWHRYPYSAIRADFAQTMKLSERVRRSGRIFSYTPSSDSRKIRIAALDRPNIGNIFTWSARQDVEWRDPTADFRLAEFCFAIPEEQFLHDGESRWLLKRLMGDILPPEILFQQGGRGFQAADWYEGLEAARAEINEWLEQLEEIPAAREILDLTRMRLAYEHWPTDGWNRPGVRETYQTMLLQGLSMGSFIRYVEEESTNHR